MWAMIGCSIAMALWTAGLTYMVSRTEKKREQLAVEEVVVEDGSKEKTKPMR